MPPSPPRRGWLLAASLFAGLVLGWLFLTSDNLHSRFESTSFDRLMLGLRWWTGGPAGRWDPNFPLGTHVLLGAPWAMGLDPVLWGRLVSLASAAVALASAGFLAGRAAGPLARAAIVAGLVLLPGFARGSVVVGEELPYTAAALGCVAALVLARERPGWLLPAILAANATVLFRLDAMTLLPGLAVVGVLLLGWRRGLLFAVTSGLSSLLHLAVSARLQGDPIGFARIARTNIQANADGFAGQGLLSLPRSLAAELGGLPLLDGWLLLLGALVGIGLALRSERRAARALGALTAWLAITDLGLVAIGALEPGIPRYLVLLSALLLLVAVSESIELARSHPPAAKAALAVFALGLLANLPTLHAQARDARLPGGLHETAEWLRTHAQTERVLVGEEHPTFVVLGRFEPQRVDVLPPGSPEENDEARLRRALDGRSSQWLVQVNGNPAQPGIEALRQADRLGPAAFETSCCRVFPVR